MIRRLLIALVCVLSLGMVLAMARRNHPQDQRYARALLFRADAAQDQIPHTGILVTASYLGARPLITEARVACAGEERSRIEYLTPPMRGLLILDDGVRSWRYDPQRGILYAEGHCRTFEERRRRNLALLLRNYQPRFQGQATVAARPALRLTLCSNYGGRVAKRLWMDSDTALVLRSEAFHPNGALLSRTTYREVSFRAPLRDMLALPKARSRVIRAEAASVPEDVLSRELGFRVQHPAYVPPGFVYEGSYRDRCSCAGDGFLAHLRYSDGLRSISLFECAHPMATGADCSAFGFTRGGSQLVRHGKETYVVMGDVEPKELQRMAASIP